MSEKIRAAADFLTDLQNGEREGFVLVLTSPAGPHTATAYASSLQRPEAFRLLMDMVMSMRNQIEPRVMGEQLEQVPDSHKIAMFELLEGLQGASETQMPRAAWRDLMLAFCVGQAHDEGITRADFERCMVELAQEEWSTPKYRWAGGGGGAVEGCETSKGEVMYQIVESTKKTYLCESSAEAGTKTVLMAAASVTMEDDPSSMAKQYIRAQLLGKVKTVSLSTANLESIEDAEEISPLIELMAKYLPLAEKSARTNATLKELEKYIGEQEQGSKSDDDED